MAVRQIPNLPPVVFLSPSAQLEIVQDGTTYRTSAGQIGALGGFHVSNDVNSTSQYYPIFLRQSSGTAESVYASDPNYLYLPSEGVLSSLRLNAIQGMHMNPSVISLNYTIPVGNNAMTAGPITASATITIPFGSSWTIV